MILAAVATGSVGGLVGLTVSGVLSRLPPGLAVGLVVLELSLPFLVYWLLKRAERPR
jgi:purine-cytosine permease-like protein